MEIKRWREPHELSDRFKTVQRNYAGAGRDHSGDRGGKHQVYCREFSLHHCMHAQKRRRERSILPAHEDERGDRVSGISGSGGRKREF